MANCLTCGNLIAEPGLAYGYAGNFCHCQPVPRIQRRNDERQIQVEWPKNPMLERFEAIEKRLDELEKCSPPRTTGVKDE